MATKKSDTDKRADLMKSVAAAAKERNKMRKEMQRHEDRVLMPLVVKAVAAGVSLRDVGEAVGVSHVTIMRMLERHRSS